MPNALFKMEKKKKFIDTLPFFYVKGKTQHVLKLYCITWETRT